MNAQTLSLLLLPLAAVSTQQIRAQATTKIDAATLIDKQVCAYHKLGLFNGSLLVADKGKIILAKGYGFANFEWKIHNTADTKFRIGSITKQFTSMLIMQLVQAGQIAVDKPITTYLDYYRKDTGDKITVHQLLRHTSGIPNYTGLPDFRKNVSGKPHEVKDFVVRYCSGDLEFKPGSRFRYSNSGYYLLGAIIEAVTGETYEQILQKKILDPAGMKDSGYDHHSTVIVRRASGYERFLQTYRNAPYLDMSNPYAAGSLYSTVEDLQRWDVALRSGKLLDPKLAKQMFTPGLQDYAYGWGVRAGTKDRPGVHRHSGGINGFNSHIQRVPAQRRCIVLFSNAGRAPLGPMARDITLILAGTTPAAPKRPPLATLAQVILDRGPNAALTHYEAAKDHANPATSEQAINNLGYQMLGLKQTANAILVFRFNVAAHPQSSNTHDSLGEAYVSAGQNQLAAASYLQALRLDPKSETAKKALKTLGDDK